MNSEVQNGTQALVNQFQHAGISIIMLLVGGFAVYFTVMIKYAKHLKVKNPKLPNAPRVARAKIAGLLCMAVTWLIIFKIRF